MIVRCQQCGKHYDDEPNWTICPHNPLDVRADAQYCLRHDLFDCYLCETKPDVDLEGDINPPLQSEEDKSND